MVASSPDAASFWREAGVHVVELPHDHDWTLLRPDRYVFACAGECDRPAAVRALRQIVAGRVAVAA